MHKLEDVIKGAWTSPEIKRWQPSAKNPTCTVRLRPKPVGSKLILPPGMMPPTPENLPIYEVIFKCDFGMVRGVPAYQISGTCKGTTIVVAQGYLEQKRPVPGPAKT